MIDHQRFNHPFYEYYREIYKESPLWDGQDVSDKCVSVYCDQGFGDIIQLLRFVPMIKALASDVVLHCPIHLHRLILEQKWGVRLWDKENPYICPHDFHIPLTEAPFVLNINHIPGTPYISVKDGAKIPKSSLPKIGICWESNPDTLYAKNKNCPLRYFKVLKGVHNSWLKTYGNLGIS